MDFENKAPDWSATGTEPPASLKSGGFQAGYKPPAAYFNWFWTQVSKCIAELQSKLASGLVYHVAGSSESGGYVKLATFKIANTYSNGVVSFVISKRNADARNTEVSIKFANENTTDPGLDTFVLTGAPIDVRLYKSETSTWELYVARTTAYESISVFDYHCSGQNNNFKVTWSSDYVQTVPSGAVQAGNRNDAYKSYTSNAGDNVQRRLLLANANDEDEYAMVRKSAKFYANPATGALCAGGFDRVRIWEGSLDDYTLSAGSPHIVRLIATSMGEATAIEGRPSDAAAQPFIVDVELIRHVSTTDYMTRQTYRNVHNPNKEYIRFCTSGVWEAWQTRLFSAEEKAPVNHASSIKTYGTGDKNNYGHVRLSDSIMWAEANEDYGVAATPSAVQQVRAKADAAYNKVAMSLSGTTLTITYTTT